MTKVSSEMEIRRYARTRGLDWTAVGAACRAGTIRAEAWRRDAAGWIHVWAEAADEDLRVAGILPAGWPVRGPNERLPSPFTA